MKALIEVVTGFLGAGKTAFINSLLSETTVEGDKISIIQLEHGHTKINEKINTDYDIKISLIHCEVNDLQRCIANEILLNNPTSIIIEYNGTDNLENIYSIVASKELKNICRLNSLYYICNGPSYEFYIKNMGELLIPFIESSNLIIINNCKYMKEDEIAKVRESLENINLTSYILTSKCNDDFNAVLRSSDLFEKGDIKKYKLALYKYINKIRRR